VYTFPENPSVDDDPDLSGHLWIQELVTGTPLRFRVAESGLVTFGTETETFDAGDDTPLPYLSATEFVRNTLDLSALRSALDDTKSVTFFGVATLYEGIDYDWSGLPAFLGVDIWSGDRDAYFAPDETVRAYEALGLSTLPAVEKEARAEYTNIEEYVSEDASEAPDSAYYDGPAAGVLARDKSGGRAVSWRSGVGDDVPREDEDTSRDEPLSAKGLAEKYVPEERIGRTVDVLRDTDEGATVDRVRERLLADVARENYARLYDDGEPVVPEKEFRSAVGERAQRYLT